MRIRRLNLWLDPLEPEPYPPPLCMEASEVGQWDLTSRCIAEPRYDVRRCRRVTTNDTCCLRWLPSPDGGAGDHWPEEIKPAAGAGAGAGAGRLQVVAWVAGPPKRGRRGWCSGRGQLGPHEVVHPTQCKIWMPYIFHDALCNLIACAASPTHMVSA